MKLSSDHLNSPANRNLSSVLQQIQDDGPACADFRQQDNLRNFKAKDNYTDDIVSMNQQDDEFTEEDTLTLSSSNFHKKQHRVAAAMLAEKKLGKGFWFQSLLLISVAVLLLMVMFRFDVRTGDIEKSLGAYDEKRQGKTGLEADVLPADITKINTVVHTLQQELQLVKTKYSSLDTKYLAMKASNISLNDKIEASAKDSVSNLKSEILVLQSELKTVQDKLNTINNKTRKTTGKTAAVATKNKLTVMLASLSNKSKAETIVKQLSAEGLLPMMEAAVVNGTQLYRLSVSGFSNRKEAESFIRKTGKKYGMKDLRLRKS